MNKAQYVICLHNTLIKENCINLCDINVKIIRNIGNHQFSKNKCDLSPKIYNFTMGSQ